jgi:hypothetical protein
MNKRQKLVQEAFLNNEEAVIRRLKSVYNQSLKDITAKTKELQDQINMLDALQGMTSDPKELARLKSMEQSKIYQKQYQDALKKQVSSILDNMQVEEFKTVSEYLNKCYEEGFLGTMYDLQGQGIPLCFPIDQTAMVRAVQLDSKISNGLYSRLGEDVAVLKKKITSEVSRGISTGMTFAQVAQQLASYTNIGFNNAVRISRTEGHRIQVQSGMDACYKAREKGTEVVKQWDASMDKRTRESHARVDGEIRELDEKFSNGLMFPGDPSGGAAEVVNCRCALLQRARWALDDDELETLKKRAEYFGLDKKDTFEDFKKKYLKAVEGVIEKPVKVATIQSVNENGTKVLADVYEKHRIENNMTSVPYAELGDSASDIVSANYGKMSVESASAFNNTINDLASEYDTPLQKIRTMTREEFKMNGDSFAYVSHNYTVDSAELVINPKKCKDFEKMNERIKELSEYGYCVKIPDEVAEQYIATHEFAHTLINLEQPLKNKTNWLNADYGKIKKARKEINAVYDEYMSEVEKLTKAKKEAEFLALTESTDENWNKAEKAIDALDAVKLSDYSLESADEFMAEAFANEKIGTASNKYSEKVLGILDKYFKR